MKKHAKIPLIFLLILFVLTCEAPAFAGGGQPADAATPVAEETEVATENATFPIEMVAEKPAQAATGKEVLAGSWKETWGIGQVTDVTYNDIYVITLGDDGKLSVSCEDRPNYSVGDVQFEDNVFKITLDNNGFIIYYSMILSADGNSFTGEATTLEDTFKVIWERVQ
jgi:hypothetical protein